MVDDVDLRAVRAFDGLFATVRSIWRPGRERDWEFRRWAVELDGRVVVPKFANVTTSSKRVGKDATAFAFSAWCGIHKPAAIVIATEAWSWSLPADAGVAARVKRELRTMPDLSYAETRAMVLERYGIRAREELLVYGKLRGREPRVEIYAIDGGRLVPRGPRFGCSGLYDGILEGVPSGVGGVNGLA